MDGKIIIFLLMVIVVLGLIPATGCALVERCIADSPGIDHIFIAFHAPAFPRVRHTENSFDKCPKLRDDFWDMIVRHRQKVRAVFSGHTHAYSRMRVKDPRGPAHDGKSYPDEQGGILQIDAGTAGNGDDISIIVVVSGRDVSFIVLDRGKVIDGGLM